MKYESRRFDERWGTTQAQAKKENVAIVTGTNDAGNLGEYGVQWVDPQSGQLHTATFPWNVEPWSAPRETISIMPTGTSGPNPLVELEVLRRTLSICLGCGLGDVFVLCSLCRAALQEARQKMLDGMVESIRSMGE